MDHSGPDEQPVAATPLHGATDRPWTRKFSKGPVRALCDEIGFPFDPRLERSDVFVAFVAELVDEVRDIREMADTLVKVGCAPPSEGSAEVLTLADAMLADPCEATASAVHDACHRLNPDNAYPTDHLIDMLSSCASAIRFGLATDRWGVGSRHAAEAANHVWKQVYGVRRFDSSTGPWETDWARRKLMEALISLLPAPADADQREVTATGGELGREPPSLKSEGR